MNGNAPCALRSGGPYEKEIVNGFFFHYGPFQYLVTAKAAAHEQEDLFNAEMFSKQRMRIHHISYSDLGKCVKIRPACFWIVCQWAGGSIARSYDVCANNEIFLWVDDVVLPYQARPPINSI